MSDAKVEFSTLDGEPAAPGAEQRFDFQCPRSKRRCGYLIIAGRTDLKRDGQNANGGVAQWHWNGDRERPTFAPSVHCKGCWHGFIEGGRCVDTSHRDEP